MAHRRILTACQRWVLFALPADARVSALHYTLSDEGLARIYRRRKPENRLGFGLPPRLALSRPPTPSMARLARKFVDIH